MRSAFIHQNMPGQFKHIAAALARSEDNEVVFITRRRDVAISNIQRVTYDVKLPSPPNARSPGWRLRQQGIFGEAALRSLQALALRDFRPDVIIGHPGWGELLFVKDLYPDVPLISYAEFYSHPTANQIYADPSRPLTLKEQMERRADSAHLLLSLVAADVLWSPTEWQKSLHPRCVQAKIETIFDGVDTEEVRPAPGAVLALADGSSYRHGEPIVTFVARGLEPTREFPELVRAIPLILKRSPDAKILIAGSPHPHYDARPPDYQTWAAKFSGEAGMTDSRVRFLGPLPYFAYLKLLQVSGAHLYLTAPSVPSWSLFEAMAAGCCVIGSDTSPVREVLADQVSGLICSAKDPQAISDCVAKALDWDFSAPLRAEARRTIIERYSTAVSVPKQLLSIDRLRPGCGSIFKEGP